MRLRIFNYERDDTGDVIFDAKYVNDDGSPIPQSETVNIILSKEGFEKLLVSEASTEEKRIQELLDKIHKIRTERILAVEKIDDRIEKLSSEAETAFQNCNDKIEVARTKAQFVTQISLLTQKRHAARLSIQEESELSLQLAKLRHVEMNE